MSRPAAVVEYVDPVIEVVKQAGPDGKLSINLEFVKDRIKMTPAEVDQLKTWIDQIFPVKLQELGCDPDIAMATNGRQKNT